MFWIVAILSYSKLSNYKIPLLGLYLTELQIRHLLFIKIASKQLLYRIRDENAQDYLFINYDQNLAIILRDIGMWKGWGFVEKQFSMLFVFIVPYESPANVANKGFIS